MDGRQFCKGARSTDLVTSTNILKFTKRRNVDKLKFEGIWWTKKKQIVAHDDANSQNV
jgi:hypothetical protein